MTLNAAVASQEATVPPKVLLLWPQGARGDTDANKPTLTIYLPPKDKTIGTAVMICLGGGYDSGAKSIQLNYNQNTK